MRFPAIKVYRAFPELDRFSDEQCQKFMKAARRGWARWLGHFLVKTLAAALVLGLVGMVMVGTGRLVGGRARAFELIFFSDWLSALILAIEFGATGLGWLFAKDWLLRRRVRRVINTRGSCPACGYSLTGLPVGPDRKVVCPECGFGLGAEADFGEVVIGEGGVGRFMPSPDVVPAFVEWLTPRRKKWVVRLAIGIPAAMVLLGLIGWGGYEFFLRRQAAVAQGARPGASGILAFVEKHQYTGAGEGSPDAWTFFYEADDALTKADVRIWRPPGTPNFDPGAPFPDFTEIFAPQAASGAEEVKRLAAARALALELIEEYRSAGVYAKLEEMAGCRRAVRPIQDPGPGRPLFDILLPELGRSRNLARINAARMKLATDAGDHAEFVSALESNLALVRMCRHQPFLIDRLVAGAIESLTFKSLRGTLASSPGPDWIEEVRGAMERQSDGPGFDVTLEGERLFMLDTVAWVFADPSRVRGGRFSQALKRTGYWGSQDPGALGTYEENCDEVGAFFAGAIRDARLEPWQRAARPRGVPSELGLLNVLLPAVESSQRVADQELLHERGLKIMLALELFRGQTGDYPESLEELLPGLLESLPLDPWSGQPFGYRRLDDGRYGRPAYVLYSVGADGIDDGGRSPEGVRDFYLPLQRAGAGLDLVISPAWVGDKPGAPE